MTTTNTMLPQVGRLQSSHEDIIAIESIASQKNNVGVDDAQQVSQSRQKAKPQTRQERKSTRNVVNGLDNGTQQPNNREIAKQKLRDAVSFSFNDNEKNNTVSDSVTDHSYQVKQKLQSLEKDSRNSFMTVTTDRLKQPTSTTDSQQPKSSVDAFRYFSTLRNRQKQLHQTDALYVG